MDCRQRWQRQIGYPNYGWQCRFLLVLSIRKNVGEMVSTCKFSKVVESGNIQTKSEINVSNEGPEVTKTKWVPKGSDTGNKTNEATVIRASNPLIVCWLVVFDTFGCPKVTKLALFLRPGKGLRPVFFILDQSFENLG